MIRYTAFCKIIECGSFTKAAEALGYTQAAVSQMIRSLESEFSLTLLTRTRTGVRLTREGEDLYPIIQKCVSVHRELHDRVGEINGLQSGELRIGTFSSMSQRLLPGVMSDFSREYPGIRFVLSPGDNTTLPDRIRSGLLDFAFLYPEASAGLTMLPIARDEFRAVLPEMHPLAAYASVSLEQMASEPLIVVEEGGVNTVLNAFQTAGLSPHVMFRIHDDYTILSMVETGIGVSILPSMLLDRIDAYRLITRPIATPVCRTVGVAFQREDLLPIAAKRFIRYLIDHIGTYLPSEYLL